MDDLTTSGWAGSEELSLAFLVLVRGSVVLPRSTKSTFNRVVASMELLVRAPDCLRTHWPLFHFSQMSFKLTGLPVERSVWTPPALSERRRLAGGGGGMVGLDCNESSTAPTGPVPTCHKTAVLDS